MTSTKRYVVRKIDTEDPWFYVVDSQVQGYALIPWEAVVDYFPESKKAHKFAEELNNGTVQR